MGQGERGLEWPGAGSRVRSNRRVWMGHRLSRFSSGKLCNG
jgi:hypothetical protein